MPLDSAIRYTYHYTTHTKEKDDSIWENGLIAGYEDPDAQKGRRVGKGKGKSGKGNNHHGKASGKGRQEDDDTHYGRRGIFSSAMPVLRENQGGWSRKESIEFAMRHWDQNAKDVYRVLYLVPDNHTLIVVIDQKAVTAWKKTSVQNN